MFLSWGEACKDDYSLSPKILSSVCRRNIQRNAFTHLPQRGGGRRGETGSREVSLERIGSFGCLRS